MLTEQQKMWARAYVANNFNGEDASKLAGYAESTLRATASRLKTNIHVQRYINELLSWRNARLDIDGDYVLKRLFEIDRLDVADILDDYGNFLPIKQWPVGWRRSITNIEYGDLVRCQDDPERMIYLLKKIKMPDKLRNLEVLGKHTLVRAFDPQSGDLNGAPPPLQITFEVAEPKAEIQITNGPDNA